jgi:hypothetical protein
MLGKATLFFFLRGAWKSNSVQRFIFPEQLKNRRPPSDANRSGQSCIPSLAKMQYCLEASEVTLCMQTPAVRCESEDV